MAVKRQRAGVKFLLFCDALCKLGVPSTAGVKKRCFLFLFLIFDGGGVAVHGSGGRHDGT